MKPFDHSMQAAIGLSPANKAYTILDNGDTFVIQEFAHQRYRMWVIPASEVPIWSGVLQEPEIDTLPSKYGVEPGRHIWASMGVVPDVTTDYRAMETAMQLLAANITNLRTELLVVKAMLAEKEPEE